MEQSAEEKKKLQWQTERFQELAIGEEGMCVVQRYDRVIEGGKIRRLHQEDFCQALGLSVSTKYEEEGGPSVESCVALLREHSVAPLEDVDSILRWVAFNAIAGNADGHDHRRRRDR